MGDEANSKSLAGVSMVVTDATAAIGEALAVEAARRGATVIANRLATPALSAEVRAGLLTAIDEDVTTDSGARRLRQELSLRPGLLVLVNSYTSEAVSAPFADMDEEAWDSVISGYLRPLYACTHHVSDLMRATGNGRVINVATLDGIRGGPGPAHVVAAQAGIAAFTRVVCRDLGPQGTTVNLIVTPSNPGSDDVQTANELAMFLCGPSAGRINGQHFLAAGHTVSLLDQPIAADSLYRSEPWTVDDLTELMPDLDRRSVEHRRRMNEVDLVAAP